jgi:hypothetical protein
MPRRKKYDIQLPPLPITSAMMAQLEYLSALQNKSTNDLVRTAVREFLDNQGEIAGSRRWFTKAFRETVIEGFQTMSWQLVLLTVLVSHGLSILIQAQLKDTQQAKEYSAGSLLAQAEKFTVDRGWKVAARIEEAITAAQAVNAMEHDDQAEDAA